MCSNYLPVTRQNRLLTFFGVEYAKDEVANGDGVFPLGMAPFIRLTVEGQEGGRPSLGHPSGRTCQVWFGPASMSGISSGLT